MGQRATFFDYATLIVVSLISILVSSLRFLLFLLLLPFAPLMTAIARWFGKSFLDIQEGRDYKIKDWRFLPRIAAYGDLGAVETYVDEWWECEDVESLTVKLLSWEWIQPLYRMSHFRLFTYLRWGLLNLQTKSGALYSAKNQYSYAVEDFFEMFAGKEAIYSIASYGSDAKTLEDAQIAKLKMISEKLQLKPGMKVLDIGCGFGALLKYMAANYGVQAFGVTNSINMAEETRKRCQGFNVTVYACDWRDIPGVYDRVVNIEMHEHVGTHNYAEYWRKVRSLVKDDGHCLLQTYLAPPGIYIAEFAAKYMWGQHFVPDISSLLKAAEKHFTFADYHDLRYNAVLTCRDMQTKLREHQAEVMKKFGTKGFRTMDFAFGGSSGLFHSGFAASAQLMFYPKNRWDRFADFGRSNEMHFDINKMPPP